ncbi:hypothetical protein [Streptomyces uncialis]|uniref:hypothetical protein n=1 Tax=Streptomyces uncialis TaxID=1048205 RepID=UPI0038699B7E|nr:McrC family protein [Streptomyces uncialis]
MDAPQDAGDDTAWCASSVLFEVELTFERFVDRVDDLSQRFELRSGAPRPFALAGRPYQLDSLLRDFVLEGKAEAVVVLYDGIIVAEVGSSLTRWRSGCR